MISNELKKIYQDIHKSAPFGKRSKFPKHLERFIEETQPKSILDYGCGKGRLIETIKEKFDNINVSGYDPANPIFDKNIDNLNFDLIVSCDVLEHIEPQYLQDTLKYLKERSKFSYHLIACCPAKLILPDGRNAHLIIESKDWWKQQFVSLGYEVIKEDYSEFYKTPKSTNVPMLIKKYIIITKTS